MTEISMPWDGLVTGDATSAPYSTREWALIWKDIVRASKANEGPVHGSGVSPDPGLVVSATTPASATVNVSPGSAVVRGTWYNSDAVKNLAPTANASGFDRIDTVVLQKNYTTQTIRQVVLPGTPNSGVPPTLTQLEGAFWEIPLADIYLPNGYVSIPGTYITKRSQWAGAADGVYIPDLLNNSGGALTDGMPVIWDDTTDRAVKTTNIQNDPRIAGIWQGYTPAGAYGRVLVRGIGYVKTTGIFLRNSVLTTYLTHGIAQAINTATPSDSKYSGLGISLQPMTAAGYCLSYVDVMPHRPKALNKLAFTDFGSTTGNVFVNVHANLVINLTAHTGRAKVTWHCQGKIEVVGDSGEYDIYCDSLATRAGDATDGLQRFVDTVPVGDYHPITIVGIFDGLATNTLQAFRLQHRLQTGAGAARLTTSPIGYAYAEEI